MLKLIIGVVLCLCGIAFGLYAGLWWAFIGGIVDVINAVKAADISAISIAIGIVKILFAGVIGTLSAFLLIVPGAALVKAS